MAGYQGTGRERLALRTFVKLVRAANGVSGLLNRELATGGLTESQFGVLEALLHLGPLTQRELAQKILRTPGNVTLILDQLEQRGLVRRQREAADRRSIRVYLTDEGRGQVATLFPAHAERVAAALQALSADEQRQLGALCRRLLLAVGQQEGRGGTVAAVEDDDEHEAPLAPHT